MRIVKYTSRFRRDYKREKSGRYSKRLDADLLEAVTMLAKDEPLPRRYFGACRKFEALTARLAWRSTLPSGSGGPHDPECDCRAAEAPVQGRLQGPSLRGVAHPAGGRLVSALSAELSRHREAVPGVRPAGGPRHREPLGPGLCAADRAPAAGISQAARDPQGIGEGGVASAGQGSGGLRATPLFKRSDNHVGVHYVAESVVERGQR